MDTAKALADIKSFLIEAGALAMAAQSKVKSHFKEGQQIVTETDLAVSKLAHERLAPWLSQKGHVLIDEESVGEIGTPQEVFRDTTYQWILDPIDGTAGYAMGRRLWGISLGLWKEGAPLLGGIYLPLQRALLLADEKRAWHIAGIGTDEEKETPISCVQIPLNSQVFVESYFGSRLDWGTKWSENKAWIDTPESAIQGFYNLFTQQAAGSSVISNFSIWDIAASYAIARRGGFAIRNMKDGTSKTIFDASDFKKSWKLADNAILCHDAQFEAIREALIEK
jgi:fructose-1,6-bisphosphatase/inositol monophosphatase family enzyme